MDRSFVRINSLLWADILVAFALFVMQTYLTDVWKLSFTHAAAILNFWGGISKVLPAFFLFLVDAFLGNFGMLVISSIAYSVGIGLLTMSTPPVLGNCKKYEPECIGHKQKVLFYTGMALIAVGVAGNLVSVKPFGEEQGEKKNENPIIRCLRIPGGIVIAIVPIIGAIALPYIKPWTLRFGIPAICTVVATILFLTGCTTYTTIPPGGSPITSVCRVFVAAVCKMSKPFPLDNRNLYREKEDESFKRTRFLRCLEKAAIMSGNEDQEESKWRLCSVAQVEEAKIAVRMVPMWLTFIICGIVSSIGNTYFVEQANNLNRNIGKWKLPPQILLLVYKWAKGFFATVADRLLGKESEKNDASAAEKSSGKGAPATEISETSAPTTEKPEPATTCQKVKPALGVGFGMVFSVLCCITAAKMEQRRLGVVRRHGLLDKSDEDIPMSVFWLIFQFILLAGLDAFLENSVVEFYKYQSPSSMKKYLAYFTKGVSGLGFMFSVLSVYVVGKISERGGKTNWFQFTLNKSRLDRYYWVLAALSSVNLLVFGVVAFCYRYRDLEATDEDNAAPDEVGELYTEENRECKCCR